MPIVRHDSPYYAPLSSTAWSLVTGSLFVIYKVLLWLASSRFCSQTSWDRFHHKIGQYRKSFLDGIKKVAEDTAHDLSPEIDGRALMWMFETLDEDREFERFFSAIPGFFNSKLVPDPHKAFFKPNGEKLSEALIGFLDRTFSSTLVSQEVKQRRAAIFSNAMKVASLPIHWTIPDYVLRGELDGLLNCVEFGHALIGVTFDDPFTTFQAQSVVSIIIARVQDRTNKGWIELVTCQLNIPEPDLQNYLEHGDSILLANCIHVCQLMIDTYSEHGWILRPIASLWKILEAVSQEGVQNAVPKLQHDFRDLWNKAVQLTQNRPDSEHQGMLSEYRRMRSVALDILKHCRRIFLALHQDSSTERRRFTASTADDDRVLYRKSTYSLLNLQGHKSYSANTPSNALGLDVPGRAGTYGAILHSPHFSTSSSCTSYPRHTNSVADTSTQSIADSLPPADYPIPGSPDLSSTYSFPASSPVIPFFPRGTMNPGDHEEPLHDASSLPSITITVARPSSESLVPQGDTSSIDAQPALNPGTRLCNVR
jgi:hypothetical protein